MSSAIKMDAFSGYVNCSANNLVLTSSRTINITAPISTNASILGQYAVGPAGAITLNATENIYSAAAATINAIGGYDPYNANLSKGGDISLSAANLSLNAAISNRGYNNNNSTTYAGNFIISNSNTATTTGINDGQVAGIFSGGNFTKSGAGTFILKNTNTYLGTTTINTGTLTLAANNTLPTSTPLILNGGTLNTGGFSQTVASISITDNSTIELTSAIHTLTSTAIGTFTNGKTLTINGWEGTYAAPGTSGTKGKIIINGTALSTTILSQIKFYKAADLSTHVTLQLTTKEIVPGN